MSDSWQNVVLRNQHPKLRMFANCDADVSSAKSEVQPALRVTTEELAASTPPLATAIAPEDAPVSGTAKKHGVDVQAQRAAVEVSVFVRSTDSLPPVAGQQTLRGMATRRMTLDEVYDLARDAGTIFIEPADALKLPRPIKGSTGGTAPARRVPGVAPAQLGDGKGMLIGIIDVEGFDWAHTDFLVGGKSRFVSIWDQGAKVGRNRKGLKRGRVISAADMQTALTDAAKIHVSPHDLEPQSQMVVGSHGTHVASIAAGNSGLCSAAEIAAVLIALPEDEIDRRTSFYDSTCLLDAVYYLLDLAGERPISINISLGTNGHAHDGSSILDRWIDALLSEPGRSICIAAGNAGQERPEAPDDLGYMMGRIHASGKIDAQGLDHILEWQVVGDKIKDASENELEIWYEPQDRLAISIRPPDGDWIGPIQPGEFLENHQLPDRTLISVYNELHHPTNGANYIATYLTPFFGSNLIIGIPAGVWQVRLHGLVIRDGAFHAWIERDDPADLGDGSYFWPSFFTEASHVDTSSVSALACGQRIVSVANLDELKRRAHITSSQGPTRDGRLKPDITAPGTGIVAANGFGGPDDPWIEMTGTSMASPYVAGVIGLMLAAEPTLTAAQILGIIKATARPLPGATYQWTNDLRFGVISPAACVAEASHALTRTELKKTTPLATAPTVTAAAPPGRPASRRAARPATRRPPPEAA
ncbi:peptidase S8 and S53 subtilisin kexin sedolisin [Mesorhizobium sp. M5C.F.Ca.IN.020.14.1.1]|nr:peptidase S8 and S53 subtilisin kexin sedolisin [Mesorhizobium sp. M5C.F.Ca.IN.020.14.1.1]